LPALRGFSPNSGFGGWQLFLPNLALAVIVNQKPGLITLTRAVQYYGGLEVTKKVVTAIIIF